MRQAILTLLSSTMLLAGAGASIAADFEGVIHLNETSDGTTTQQQWYLKGDRLRFEEVGPESGKGAMIFDAKKKLIYSIDHEEKAYIEIPSENTGEKMMQNAASDMVVTKTGKRDKAAGYACDIYVSKDKSDGSTSELCVAKGLGNAAMFGLTSAEAGRSSMLPAWMREIFKDGGFPIKGVDRDEQGQEESRWEAVKIEKKRLDDKLFLPPADYKRQDMAGMMQQRRRAQDDDRPSTGKAKTGKGQDSEEEPLDMDALLKQFGDAMKQGQSKSGR